ncbi:MAG: hypothetical protein HND47_01560 [Chloroflexi bacterium]|nr:hypothetical protein [Chloroflexota bacterium]
MVSWVPLESPQALADAVLQLCSTSEAQRREMGGRGRARILESYTTDRMCEQYLQVIEQGLGEGKAPAAESGTGEA